MWWRKQQGKAPCTTFLANVSQHQPIHSQAVHVGYQNGRIQRVAAVDERCTTRREPYLSVALHLLALHLLWKQQQLVSRMP